MSIVSVELVHGDATGTARGHCKVRHNFGYTGPLVLGVSRHFLEEKGEGEERGGEGNIAHTAHGI